MIPEVIVFERHLKHLPSIIGAGNAAKPAQSDEPETEQAKVLSPLERRRAKMLEAQKPPEPEKTPEALEAERKAKEEEAEKAKEFHGSVSLRDVATYIKDRMLLDPEASRVHVQAEEIKFLGLDEGVDRVEKVGRFEIEIRTHVGRDKVEPIRRSVEIVAA